MSDIDTVFTALFDKYYSSLLNYCIAKKTRKQDAEDIVSEAFARALAKSDLITSLNEKQQKAWLYSAVSLIIKEKLASKELIAFSEIENYVLDVKSCLFFISTANNIRGLNNMTYIEMIEWLCSAISTETEKSFENIDYEFVDECGKLLDTFMSSSASATEREFAEVKAKVESILKQLSK